MLTFGFDLAAFLPRRSLVSAFRSLCSRPHLYRPGINSSTFSTSQKGTPLSTAVLTAGRNSCTFRSSELWKGRIVSDAGDSLRAMSGSSKFSCTSSGYEGVLDFWFNQMTLQQRFGKDDEVDEHIRSNFGDLHEQACKGQLESWKSERDSCLALLIVLDQFSRNLHRGTGHAFENDELAREVACHFLAKGFHEGLPFVKALFAYLPFMHSESLDDQKRCLDLCQSAADRNEDHAKFSVDYSIAHLKIIERFGRFPHRNESLGRESSAEEKEFLTQPGSSF